MRAVRDNRPSVTHKRRIQASFPKGDSQTIVNAILNLNSPQTGSADMKLDQIDIKILAELQKNGRLTNNDLADRVHLSASPCLMRLKRLRSAGFIRGFAAEIDLARLADVLTVFTEVTLARHRPQDLARFVTILADIDNVVECHLVSSGYDYLVKFNTCGISEYQEIVERLLDMDVGLKKYFSYVVFKTPIMPRQLPVSAVFRNSV